MVSNGNTEHVFAMVSPSLHFGNTLPMDNINMFSRFISRFHVFCVGIG